MGVPTPGSGFDTKSLYALFQDLRTTLLGYPNLRAGTTAARLTTDAFAFRIGNQVYTTAAQANVQVTGLTNTTAIQFRKVRVEINTAGTISFREGGPATAQAVAEIPRKTENRVTLGWIEIPASFTYDTTSLSAAGVTIRNGDPDLGVGTGVPPNDRGLASTILSGP